MATWGRVSPDRARRGPATGRSAPPRSYAPGIVIVARGLGWGSGWGALYGAAVWVLWGAFMEWRHADGKLATSLGLTPIAGIVGAVVGLVLGGLSACVVAAVRPPHARVRPTAAAICGSTLGVVLLATPFVPITTAYWWTAGIFAAGAATAWVAAPRLVRRAADGTPH